MAELRSLDLLRNYKAWRLPGGHYQFLWRGCTVIFPRCFPHVRTFGNEGTSYCWKIYIMSNLWFCECVIGNNGDGLMWFAGEDGVSGRDIGYGNVDDGDCGEWISIGRGKAYWSSRVCLCGTEYHDVRFTALCHGKNVLQLESLSLSLFLCPFNDREASFSLPLFMVSLLLGNFLKLISLVKS